MEPRGHQVPLEQAEDKEHRGTSISPEPMEDLMGLAEEPEEWEATVLQAKRAATEGLSSLMSAQE
ncbi:hypothetical protein BDD14_5493 [Edaphobacter modestus]|uniref:Uncharacterized protein n=1 Tax=Edaphobacter modestus TaxID=388466 RepID=A0A4Q7YFA5_9BACT|nr:hypothetical protein BDD14_5493 [Edaphobacter modestus]